MTKGIDFQCLSRMIQHAWMIRTKPVVVPGGQMGLALPSIYMPFVWHRMARRQRSLRLA